jgi:hypothetical protein
MKAGAKKSAPLFVALTTAAAVVASFALNACTNNVSPAETKSETPATTIYSANLTKGNPLDGLPDHNSPVWRAANWTLLKKATNENKQLPETRVACVYDANNLYVALVGVPSAAGASQVSIWLDCSAKQNGTELIEIGTQAGFGVTNGMKTEVMRHRSVKAPEIRETPDFTLPMDHIAETTNFLKIVRGKTAIEGKEAWSVVMAIPYKALHFPPNFTPTAGYNWRFNLLRTDTTTAVNGATEVVQANLSPVHAGAQHVMPYRMGTMTLAKNNAVGQDKPAAKPVRVAVSR